jgi:hypothetical protein
VEHTSCRDGVVSVKFSHSPSPDVLRELKMAGMSFNREARMWRGPWSQELVEVAKLLFPDANPSGWKPAQLLDPTEQRKAEPRPVPSERGTELQPSLQRAVHRALVGQLAKDGWADAVTQALQSATVAGFYASLLQLQCGPEQFVRLSSEPVRTAMEDALLAITGSAYRVEVISA